ncbi:XdhC family protein [Compostibacter hankyongensis]|uniref:XdhC family protein n=1 Tax=Compostibacter hankyongensis TaxID=1007089 RepID=A0ABP8FLJ2_9BACT
MKELRDIVAAYDQARQHNKQAALATVVQVEGSSYRRPGARMLITEDGGLTGAISGGCLEGDALKKARLVMLQQKNRLVTYDTTHEDDAKLGVGLGCNGIIRILIEPLLAEDPAHPVCLLKDFFQKRRRAVLVTLFSSPGKNGGHPGTVFLRTEDGKTYGAAGNSRLRHALEADAEQVLLSGHSRIKTFPGGAVYAASGMEGLEKASGPATAESSDTAALTVFLEVLEPPVSLLIFGAGNDAIPLAGMAAVLGWEVTVIDGRIHYATTGRFPAAGKVIVSGAEKALEQLSPDHRTVAVLMTHNYNYDLAILRQLLPLRLPYLGSLGPRKKLERMLEDLQREGRQQEASLLQNVYGPTGLDIGAETPEEIALSVISEIKAVLSGRPCRSLRDMQLIPHHHEAQPGQS